MLGVTPDEMRTDALTDLPRRIPENGAMSETNRLRLHGHPFAHAHF